MQTGDPVDVATGRVYTVDEVDVQLPGPLPLVVVRKYSTSSRRRDVGLGWGWTHTLAWEIRLRRRHLELWDSDGSSQRADIPADGQRLSLPRGRTLLRVGDGFVVQEDDQWRFFTRALEGPDVTVFRLTAIADSFDNVIHLGYDDQWQLVLIRDAVGREVRVGRHADGHISKLSMKNAHTMGQWIVLAQYEYDTSGHLVRTYDADGFAMDFSYDENHRLTSHTKADSPTFHFVYDAAGRCIETWGDFADGRFPGLHPDVPTELADGSPAKGILHAKLAFDDGYVECVNSRSIRRFHTNEHGLMDKSINGMGGVTTRTFDAEGNLTGHTDEENATHLMVRDARGNLLQLTDPLGHVTSYARDERGRPLEIRDAVGVVLQAQYGRGNRLTQLTMSLGDTTRWTYDDRGLPLAATKPNGGRMLFEHDAHGNLTKVTEPDGLTHEWAYDYWGRTSWSRDSRGQERRYTWTNRGLCQSVHVATGDVLRFRYNGRRLLTEQRNNRRRTLIEYNGLGRKTRITHPNDTTVEALYDREGDLVELRNEKGETRRYERNDGGLPVRRENFDGRVEHLKYDGRGRLIEVKDERGTTELLRDALGRIVEVNYPDDTSARFKYDARSNLIEAANHACKISYEVNAAGLVVREVHQVDGKTFSFERDFNEMRAETASRRTFAPDVQLAYDVMGRRTQMAFDGREVVGFQYRDNREAARQMSGGARIEHRWDTMGALLERRLVVPHAAPAELEGEPDWVGAMDDGTVLRKVFEYNDTHNLVRRFDSLLGEQAFTFDARERVVESRRGDTVAEAFWYDETNNVYEPGATSRTYASGDKLVDMAGTEFDYDDLGFLIRKRVPREDGGADDWQYAWNGAGHLERVDAPDGRVIQFTYDPWARRQAKYVSRRGVTGIARLESVTRFVWDRQMLAHEIREEVENGAARVVEEISYSYDGRGRVMAHREVRHGESPRERWLYYVNNHRGVPEQLVTSGGEIVCELERTVWGKTKSRSKDGASTPLRFHGQYEDEETGLHYNRYRYYDPEAGRFISPDPVGNLPDPNLYRYCDNPIDYIDPLGLAHHVTGATFIDGDGETHTLGKNGELVSGLDDQARADMRAQDASGNAVYTSTDNQENYVGHLDATVVENGNTVPCPRRNQNAAGSSLAKEHFTDTEAKAIREVERLGSQGYNLDGGSLSMTGEKPPCGFCQSRMVALARQHGASTEYRYPIGGSPQHTFRVESNGVGNDPTVTRPNDPELQDPRPLPARGGG